MENVSRAVVLGAGYLGLELAENLVRRGVSVTVLQSANQVMPTLDREMAAYIASHLQEHQIELRLNSLVTSFQKNSAGDLEVHLESGDIIRTDVAMISIGVIPRTELAVKAELELGELGGIRVNEYMQTSDPNIWAVGDVVEVRNTVTGDWQLFP